MSLDARDPSAGSNWTNKGTMGNFTRIGKPKLTTASGQPAVQFNGTSDAYRSEQVPPRSQAIMPVRLKYGFTIPAWIPPRNAWSPGAIAANH